MKRLIFKFKNNVRLSEEFSKVIHFNKEYFYDLNLFWHVSGLNANLIDSKCKIYNFLKSNENSKTKIKFLFYGIENFSSFRRVVIQHYKCPCLPFINLYNFFCIDFEDGIIQDSYQNQLNAFIDVIESTFSINIVIPNPRVIDFVANQTVNSQNYQDELEIGLAWNRYKFLSLPIVNSTLALNMSRFRLGSYTGLGRNINIIDIESAWRTTHNQYATVPVPLLNNCAESDGSIYGNGDVNHGTKSIGVLNAKHDDDDVSGLTPNASIYLASNNCTYFTAIMAAICKAYEKKGSIILIESQQSIDFALNNAYLRNDQYIPIEFKNGMDRNLIRELIEIATKCLGIVVIEAAGNNSLIDYRNLDLPVYSSYFQEGFDSIPDSGAIIVGAVNYSENEFKYKLKDDSCYGRRVDLFVWGENIKTLDISPNGTGYDDITFNYFSQTSASTAIVAGICASLQSISVNEFGKAIPPLVLRSWLQNNPKKTDFNIDLATTTFVMPRMSDLINKLENYHSDL